MDDYILGLDLGPNSIGWALVRAERQGDGFAPAGLLNTGLAGHPPLGVRVFEAGLQNFNTGKEASKNQARRQARATRRTISRRRERKRAALAALVGADLLPPDTCDLEAVMAIDPYEARAAALDRALRPFELGRALYHLAQRRGFKSNRLSESDSDEKGMLLEISRLEKEIQSSGARTLGEFLHTQRKTKVGGIPARIRARQARMDLYADAPRRTRRSMYEFEFAAILEAQREFGGRELLTAEARLELHRALFFQHPFAITEERIQRAPSRANLHRAPGVRACPYEKDQFGCPRSDWLAQRFRILKEVQSLRLSEQHRRERALTPEEVMFTIQILSGTKEKGFAQLARDLTKEFQLTEPVTFNLARGGRGGLKGNAIDAALAKGFGKRVWRDLDESACEALRTGIVELTTPSELDELLQRHGLDDSARRRELCNFRSPDDGYLSFSKRALLKLIPLMEAGRPEHEAIAQVYPETFEADGLASLPSLVGMQLDPKTRAKIPPQIQNELTNLTNPIVRRALVEVRKVVNAIVRTHGRPARVVVEMAREMKQGKTARKEQGAQMNARAKRREDARAKLRSLRGGGEWPSRDDVNRWMLWEEQCHCCPYCGKGIAMHEVANADVEVDHILPRWRSMDDSMNNKVLCCSVCNADKGNRTPAEWKGKDSPELALLLKRAWACVAKKDNPGGMPFGKIKRFEVEDLEPDKFASSQLNDTRYISRLVGNYMRLLYPTEEHSGQSCVQSSKGNLTAHLRRMWGLNGVIPPLVQAHGEVVSGIVPHEGWNEKVRVDHRHHAVDALVVALSSAAFVKRLQDCWRRDEDPTDQGASFEAPWASLRADTIEAVQQIRVSHRPMRRKRGALHEETYYGAVDTEAGRYVTRKALNNLTPSTLKDIRDPKVRAVIEERLRACGWQGGTSVLPKGWFQEELFLPVANPKPGRRSRSPHPIRRVRIEKTIGRSVRLGDKGHRHAVPGGNFCLQVFHSDTEKSPQFRVLSRFEASQRGTGLAAPTGFTLAATLHRKDSVLVEVDGLEEPVHAVIQMISGPSEIGTAGLDVTLRDARDSRKAGDARGSELMRIKSAARWKACRIRPLGIDPMGLV